MKIWNNEIWPRDGGPPKDFEIGDYYFLDSNKTVYVSIPYELNVWGYRWIATGLDQFDVWVLEQRQNREICNNDSGS